MNERELGDALLRWTASQGSSPTEPRPGEMIDRVLTRDRRRVRRLAFVTATLWLVAVACIPLFFAAFATFILPKANYLAQETFLHERKLSDRQLADDAQTVLLTTAKLGMVVVTASVLVLLLAAWGTVWLVGASRRATLRQVNANLAEIAEALRKRAA